MPVSFGIDQLLKDPPAWRRQRIGLVTNHAATTSSLQPSRQALLEYGFGIRTLFSPEHGLDVKGADGHEMKNGTDGLTGLPIISLYSTSLAPDAADLRELDVVIYDIPDVGCRFYTYLWTLTHVMEACARHGKKLVVLDRPNPVSGNMDLAEGPVLDEAQASFVGRWALPIRHSCTLGELAAYFNASRNIGCLLEIVPCAGWDRRTFQPDWGIPFVPTSPAIQSFQSMLLYPGLCLLEATNISEGRGTPDSFCCAGAPWIDGEQLAGLLQQTGMEDVSVRPVRFTPADKHSKYVHTLCSGVCMEVTEPRYFKPVFFGLMLIRLIRDLYPSRFNWRPYPTLVNPGGHHHLDKLMGMSNSEALFDLPFPKFIAAATRITGTAGWGDGVGKLYDDN